MPIEKMKRTQKPIKRKTADSIAVSPDLDKKKAEFKQAVTRHTKTTTPKSHSNRKRSLIIAVAAFLVLVGSAATVFAYHWYKSPEAIVLQSVMNAANEPSASYTGTLAIAGAKPSSFNGSYEPGKTLLNAKIATPLDGTLSTLNLSLLSANQHIYAKVDHASDLAIQTAQPDQQSLFKSIIPKYASKIDGKWLSVSKDEIGSFKDTTGFSRCMIDIFESITTSSSARDDISKLYMQHPFMNVTTQRDESNGDGNYRLEIKPADFNAFMNEMYTSQYFASLASCSKQNDAISANDLKGFYINLTIDKSARQIKNVTMYSGDKTLTTVQLTPTFGKVTPIAEPKDAFSLDVIKTDILKRLLMPSN